MSISKLTVAKVCFSALLFAITLTAGTNKAEAATLTVNSGCTLSEAMDAIDLGQDQNGCNNGGSNYGTNDKISLPAGTTTLTSNLPGLGVAHDLVIEGAGRDQTTIDAAGHTGFSYATSLGVNFTIKDLSITNASPHAIHVTGKSNTTLDHIQVTNSTYGVFLNNLHDTLKFCIIKNNNVTTSNTGGDLSGVTIALVSDASEDTSTVSITDSDISNNSSETNASGVMIFGDGTEPENIDIEIRRTSINSNSSVSLAGIGVIFQAANTKLESDAVTIAHNTVVTNTTYHSDFNCSGVFFRVGNIVPNIKNFTNVTIAYNTITNTASSDLTVAGFLTVAMGSTNKLNLVNTTVVGNSATQTTPPANTYLPSFMLLNIIDTSPDNGSNDPDHADVGATSLNGLISNNTFNGQPGSCNNSAPYALFNFPGSEVIDTTPTNNGHNLSDDPKCTDYQIVSNLYDTIDHDVNDNGGPVKTIKLLPGSPAINAGGQVLGITTDARGVARDGYYSVGAYQGVLAAATTADKGTLATTGTVRISTILLLGIALGSAVYVYYDYRKHRAPLKAIDPHIRYTLAHHIRVVSIPVLQYRLRLSIQRAPASTDFHKF